ncbi:MAG: hypothetical protein LAQ69_05470 [Acidobacteriia bacterium]|nr:hypothetical protein [Terriglobia bacterium]
MEQGVSNEGFPNERAAVPGCVFNATPEDHTNIDGAGNASPADNVTFANFMRLTAPPTPMTPTSSLNQSSLNNGQSQFNIVGCNLCHSTSLTTARSPFTGMSNVIYQPYSDIAIHHMGSTLTDGINQGDAGPDEFRTAPLWGIGQRIFFLHDGRTSDLLVAIQAHFSPGNVCATTQDFQQFSIISIINPGVQSFFNPFSVSRNCGSEANGVINNFNALSPSQKQDILNFLRSL